MTSRPNPFAASPIDPASVALIADFMGIAGMRLFRDAALALALDHPAKLGFEAAHRRALAGRTRPATDAECWRSTRMCGLAAADLIRAHLGGART